MSLELVNTFASLGTFLVIAATAAAAIVQLRHARSSNQIAAFNRLQEAGQAPDFVTAQRFVMQDLAAKLQDPEFRYEIAPNVKRSDETRGLRSKVNAVGNYYESMGLLVKRGLVDRYMVLEMWANGVITAWRSLAPFTALVRRSYGDAFWENFEYLTVLAQDWLAANPNGSYPVGVRRIHLEYTWLAADDQYAASRVPG